MKFISSMIPFHRKDFQGDNSLIRRVLVILVLTAVWVYVSQGLRLPHKISKYQEISVKQLSKRISFKFENLIKIISGEAWNNGTSLFINIKNYNTCYILLYSN